MMTLLGPRTVRVPRVLEVGAGAVERLGSKLPESFDLGSVVMVSGDVESRAIAARIRDGLDSVGELREVVGPEGTTEAAARLLEDLDRRPATLMLAVGGGRTIDVAKLASTRAGIDFVAVPTVLSHDGMTSPVASLADADGVRRSIGATMPAGVVVDTTICRRAPGRFLRAGIGDLASNFTAIDDWRRAASDGDEAVDELAASLATMSASAVLDIAWPPSERDVDAIARGLVMSGLAMEIAGSSRPCSGAEHLFSHALDELDPGSGRMHGEQVALGTLLVAPLYDGETSEQVERVLSRVGFRHDLADWGVDEDLAIAALLHASSTRPGRRTVLDATTVDVAATIVGRFEANS